jgi:hypothetical protein
MARFVIAGVLLLMGCVPTEHPASSDNVRDASTAIAVAEKVCPQDSRKPGDHWEAKYAQGIWVTRLMVAKPFMTCDWSVEADVNAANGESPYCSVCIPRTDRIRN